MTKLRLDLNGVHFFDRDSGLNILLDEISVPAEVWSAAPRFVSLAITNLCDLKCKYCYAPKTSHSLSIESVCRWARELDDNGCLGIGLGGGEPTLHKEFFKICDLIKQTTELAVSVTTHLNRLDREGLDHLCQSTHFVRVSMDGVGGTYERLRQRSFTELTSKLAYLASKMRIGINFVVNEETISDIDAASRIASELGVAEFVLLPQMQTAKVAGISTEVENRMRKWLATYGGTLQISISDSAAVDGMSIANPYHHTCGSYAHVDAMGFLKKTSFSVPGIPIGDNGFMATYLMLCKESK
jgi:sulfatase maturation enzyme AslB (radical SAM superfamily)